MRMKKIHINFSEADVASIDGAAQKERLSRSALVRRIVMTSLEGVQ
jgi:hypothetical protein